MPATESGSFVVAVSRTGVHTGTHTGQPTGNPERVCGDPREPDKLPEPLPIATVCGWCQACQMGSVDTLFVPHDCQDVKR